MTNKSDPQIPNPPPAEQGFDGAKPSHRPLPQEFIEALRNVGVSAEFLARVEAGQSTR